MSNNSNCEWCANYVFNEDYDYYECERDLDEDEMAKFITNTLDNCPFFNSNEYNTVNKQI